jgi:class 3 adenylate cyclase
LGGEYFLAAYLFWAGVTICVRVIGPVSGVIDVTGKGNVAGAGINMAQRVMDCGDAGHILVSKHVAEDIEQYPHWQPYLHELGECEVKHGVRVSVVN